MKKLFTWYNLLNEKGLIDLNEKEEEIEEAEKTIEQ